MNILPTFLPAMVAWHQNQRVPKAYEFRVQIQGSLMMDLRLKHHNRLL
jgi:hypothetical protein